MMMAMSKADLTEAGITLRTKAKNAVVLSDADQARVEADEKFLKSIAAGNVDDVIAILDAGQDANVADENGMTAVHKVMISDPAKSDAMLSKLIDKGAFCDFADNYGSRPITYCMQQVDILDSVLAKLIELRDKTGARVVDLASINTVSGNGLLHDAAWVGNTNAADLLLKTGAFEGNMNPYNKQGQTPLHLAAFRSPKEMVVKLTEAGGDVNLVEKNTRRISKEGPLELASAMGREDTANYLRELKAAADAVRFAAKMKMKTKKSAEAAADELPTLPSTEGAAA